MGLSSADLESELTTMVEIKKSEIKDIKLLNKMIEKALANNLTTGFFELTVSEVLDLLVFISSKITKNQLDEEYEEAAFYLTSVFRMPVLNEIETKMLKEMKDFLSFLSVTTSLGLAEQSEALISVKGFVFQTANSSMSFEKQKKILNRQIKTIRKNKEKMNEVSEKLESMSKLKVVCSSFYATDCTDAQPKAEELFKQLVVMTQLVVENMVDPRIATESELILTLIKQVTIVTREQKDVFNMMSESIAGDVLIYVSQIALLESRLLEIDGALTFTETTTELKENDFELRKVILSAQLTNLFQINNAMDQIVKCIEKIEALPESEDSNDELIDKISQVTALASEARPPVKEIQRISMEINRECADKDNLEMNSVDLKLLKFLKNPLVTFEQMFTSQISVFSQKLATITGRTVTAANLDVEMISATGDLVGALEAINVTIDKQGSKEFYMQRYQLMKSTLYTLDMVMQKINRVLNLTKDGIPYEGTILPQKFALLVVHYVSHSLSEGVITKGKATAARRILKAQVTAATSSLDKIILKKALSTITSLKMTILTEIVNSKIQLITALEKNQQHISDLKFTIKTFDSSGNIVNIEETEFKSTSNVTDIQAEIALISKTQVMLSKVQNLLNETIYQARRPNAMRSRFSTKWYATQEDFMSELISFTLQMGKNFKAGSLLDLGSQLLTYRPYELSGAAISKLKYIMFTIQNYRILISEEIVDLRSEIGEQLYSKYQGCTASPLSAPATTTPSPTTTSPAIEDITSKNIIFHWKQQCRSNSWFLNIIAISVAAANSMMGDVTKILATLSPGSPVHNELSAIQTGLSSILGLLQKSRLKRSAGEIGVFLIKKNLSICS